MISVLVSFVLGFIGATIVSHAGNRMGLVDWPNERSSHFHPVPKGGGIGILTAFCVLAAWNGIPLLLWLPASILSLISLLGDRFNLSVKLRLAVQFISAGAVCWGIMIIPPGIFGEHCGKFPFGLLISVIYIVATANIFNFMDGINGIAGITGMVAFGLLAWAGWMRGESIPGVMLAAGLAAACAGFLPWNFPRARVFLGDVGSILLGFAFALFVVSWSATLVDFLMFASFLLPFYVDEGVTILARLKRGESLTVAHRRHVYQILANQMGISHRTISIAYGLLQLIVGALAFLLSTLGLWELIGFLTLTMTGMAVGAWQVRHHE